MGDHDPGARVVAPEVNNGRQTVISRQQVLQLARACQHRGVGALIWVLYSSGMRVSEAQRAARVDGMFVLPDTKNGEPRIIPIHPRALAASRVPIPPRTNPVMPMYSCAWQMRRLLDFQKRIPRC